MQQIIETVRSLISGYSSIHIIEGKLYVPLTDEKELVPEMLLNSLKYLEDHGQHRSVINSMINFMTFGYNTPRRSGKTTALRAIKEMCVQSFGYREIDANAKATSRNNAEDFYFLEKEGKLIFLVSDMGEELFKRYTGQSIHRNFTVLRGFRHSLTPLVIKLNTIKD